MRRTGQGAAVSIVACALLVAAGELRPGPRPVRSQTGRLEGNVVVSRQLSSRVPRFRLYSEYGGQPVPPAGADDTAEHSNVVIYLDSVPEHPGAVPRADTARIRQQGETFRPHVLPVLVGFTVAFPNDDPFFHNVFSLSRTKSFDLGRYPQGSSKSVRFDRPGLVQVFCHIHSDMNAIILVRPNRFFTVPDASGRFVIGEIPPGDYRAVAWHERARPVAAAVRIEPGRAAAVEFTIPLPHERPRRP